MPATRSVKPSDARLSGTTSRAMLHPSKGFEPNFATLAGSSISVILQFLNALFPISFSRQSGANVTTEMLWFERPAIASPQ